MKIIIAYQILAYFCLSLAAIGFIYLLIAGEGFHMFSKVLMGVACGLGLLAEVRRLKKKTEEEAE